MTRQRNLHWQILGALVLGVGAGLLWGEDSALGPVRPMAVYDFLGTMFLRALKMVIVPLITGSIVSGIASVGAGRGLGRLFGRTFAWYVSTSLLAIVTGLVLVNLLRPGTIDGAPAGGALGLEQQGTALQADLEGKGAGDLVGILQRMVPDNPVAAAAEGQMLPLIFFCVLLGLGIAGLDPQRRDVLVGFFDAVFAAMMRVTGWVIAAAPVGIFGLVAKIAATAGFAALAPLLRYGGTVLLALLIHAAVTLPLLVHLVGRLPARRHARVMAPALLTAFSTRSSSATLPLTMDRIENGAGVSNRVTSFVLPLGATINMDGTALYECVAAMFIAQAYGVDLGPAAQFLVVLTALLASIGAAGIPAAGLVMMSIILDAVGLPLEGIALILAIDPLLDMVRTAVNVWSDSCGAVVVAAREGETGVLRD